MADRTSAESGESKASRKWADKKLPASASEMRNLARQDMKNKRSDSISGTPTTPTPSSYGSIPSSESSMSIVSVASDQVSVNTITPEPAQAEEIKVEVPDYDKLLKEKRKLIDSDPAKDILLIPEDDVLFEIAPHEYRTTRSSLPKQASELQLPVYMQDTFDFYTADWTVVKKKNEHLSHFPRSNARAIEEADSNAEKRKLSANSNISYQKYEVDMRLPKSKDETEDSSGDNKSSADIRTMFTPGDKEQNRKSSSGNDLQSSEADPIVPQFLTPDGQVEAESEGPVSGDMLRFFRDLEFIEQAEEVEERPMGEPFKEEFGRRILIDCQNLIVGEDKAPEPFFGILALYDLAARKKISENFHFDTNSDETMELISKHTPAKDIASLSKQALFQVNYPNPDIYLVLRIEKVLEGEASVAFDRYGQSKVKPSKETLAEFCDRLGKYRQPFAWAAIQLFNTELEIDVGQESLDDCTMRPLFRQDGEKINDEEIIANIISTNSQKGTKKFKAVAGELKFKLREVYYDEQLPNSLTPFLVPVKPFSAEEGLKIVREVEEFPQNPIVQPQIDYVNTLYVYPQSLNMSKYQGTSSARNIAVKVQFLQSADIAQPGMKAIYGKSSSKTFVSESWAAVSFHSKTPTFYEEIKIAIPLNLSKTHHILFTFCHVGCKPKKPQEEHILGYAWLPVYENGHIIKDDVYSLPIATELEKNYDTSANKFMDGKKPLFTLRTKLMSSIYTHDASLSAFFTALQDVNRANTSGDDLAKALLGLLNTDKAALVHFSPVLFDECFNILSKNFSNDAVYQNAFRALILVVSTVHNEKGGNHKRDPSLVSYIKYRYSNKPSPARNVFEEIIRLALYFVENMTQDPIVKDFERFAWFFFDVCMKSTLQYLDITYNWKPGSTPEVKTWLKQDHVKAIKRLFPLLTQEVLKHSKTSLIIGKELNESMAYFLTDMVVCFERKMIFRLIQVHVSEINNDSEVLIGFKFDFLRFVCGYEHFIALNLPTIDYMEKPFDKLSSIETDFWKRHYLAGLLLHEVNEMMNYPNRLTRLKAITTLKELIGKHDADPRHNTKEKRARVAGIYFPFIPILIHNYGNFVDEREDVCFTTSERRSLLIVFMFIIRNLDQKWLFEWLKRENVKTFTTFVDILTLCVDTFQYLGKEKIMDRHSKAAGQKANPVNDMKRQFENFYSSSMQNRLSSRVQTGSLKGTAQTIARNSSANKGSMSSKSSISGRTSSTSTRSSFKNTLTRRTISSTLDVNDEIKLEGALASEISVVVLDVFEVILMHQNPKAQDSQQSFKMFELLTKFLEKHQSERVLLRLFNTVKAFVFKFPQSIFREGSVFCSELCRLVLRYCASMISSVRQYAGALLYLLMKKNYEATKGDNFMKVRVQMTVALSKLQLKEDEYLRRALATAIQYSVQDKEMQSTKFPSQVKDAVDKLFIILRDSVKMNDHKNDNDMLSDMHYRIAKGYMNAPDLRLASLDTLTRLQFQDENWAEAGYCLLHSAALVAQCLQTMKEKQKINIDLRGLPAGAAAFTFISENLSEEINASTEGEGIGESPAFSERGLTNFLEQSTNYFAKAHLYETINDVYKLLLPIYERNKDWATVGTAHYTIHKHMTELVKANQTGRRFLGTYFRVAFFGSRFGALNGQEYIFKEKKITRLADVSLRLEGHYSEKFKPENFELIRDSDTVDLAKLDPNKAYLQITYVEPYLTEEDLAVRTTAYERMNHINKFFFETPYTKEGKSQGGVEVQWKRKTIVQTEMYFPYVKRRQLIIKQHDIHMNPLEVSLESIAKRCEALQAAINGRDAKSLQVVLQGSVRLQVNAGPLEIANTFLSPEKVDKYDQEMIKSMRRAFAEFLRLCYQALDINRSLVKHDQRAYQEDLEEGYEEVKAKLLQYLDSSYSGDINRSAGMNDPKVKNILELISGVDQDTSTFLT